MFLFRPNVRKLKDKRNVKGLIKVLRYQKDSSVRQSAVEALVRIGAPAVEPLIAALRDEYRMVRSYAADALGEIGDSRAVEPLIAALGDENRYSYRKEAAQALVTLYRRGNLDMQSQQKILAVREIITKPHESHYSGSLSDCVDVWHGDQGIGVEF